MNRFTIPDDPLASVSFWLVISIWLIFAAVILFRRGHPGEPERRRNSWSTLGVILQGIAYFMVWTFRRNGAPMIPSAGRWFDIVIEIAAPLCAACSVWLVISAIRTLGKQWSIAARVIEDHVLMSTGAYAIIRHPIYAGMLGMLIATGLVLSRWEALAGALILFLLGSGIRIQAEDRLLAEEFGPAFHEYSRRVPSLLPRIPRKRQ